MKVKVICVGKTKKGYLTEGIEEYLSRLKHYVHVEWIEVRSSQRRKSAPIEEGLRQEADRICSHIHPSALMVTLGDGGKEYSSREFAQWLEHSMVEGRQEIDFVIGGDQGIAPALTEEAGMCISLSRMTFTHQMVRLILLEQLYRAFSIIRGEPYHHG
ncbi:MAG: 23S rRNA (pseudouridine(1915)-N(3))-methyltransferase RlmH [bacterium]